MKKLGFQPTINSGAGWIAKEDGENDQCLCQLKSTDKLSISVKQNDLHILENNASIAHKLPVFALQFINTDEIWLMVKPEHIKDIQGILSGEQIEIKDTFMFDNDEDVCYNEEAEEDNNKNICKSYKARMKYKEQCKKEAEQREKEYKEREKERRTKWKNSSIKKE